jgi:hypothetical protein
MNLEQREMIFKQVMNEFIILLKPSPRILNNLFLNTYRYRVNPVNLRPEVLAISCFRDCCFLFTAH